MKQTQLIALLVASLAPVPFLSAQVTTQSSTQQTGASVRSAIESQLPRGVTLETATPDQLASAVQAAVSQNPTLASQIAAVASVAAPDAAPQIVSAAAAAVTAGQSDPQARAQAAARIANTTAAALQNAGNDTTAEELYTPAAQGANVEPEVVTDVGDTAGQDDIPDDTDVDEGEGDGDSTEVELPEDEDAESEPIVEDPDIDPVQPTDADFQN
ncbi:MAG: hypothetical protein E1N59_500 [Puniceicoccaceae bacterium 5H]|nr:MAG: hypothetical protein E1N59_500 [Puniceicoccaceae bacterium 5H]